MRNYRRARERHHLCSRGEQPDTEHVLRGARNGLVDQSTITVNTPPKCRRNWAVVSWNQAGATGGTGPAGGVGGTGATGGTGQVGGTGAAGLVGGTGPVGGTGGIGGTGPVGGTGAVGGMGAIGGTGPVGGTGATGPVGGTGPPGISGITFANGDSSSFTIPDAVAVSIGPDGVGNCQIVLQNISGTPMTAEASPANAGTTVYGLGTLSLTVNPVPVHEIARVTWGTHFATVDIWLTGGTDCDANWEYSLD